MKASLWAMVTASVFVGAAGVLSGGCGKSEAQMATDTARTFMSGMANHDRTMVENTLTALARKKMDEGETSVSDKNGMGESGYSIGTPTIDGDSANVPVTITKAADTDAARSDGGEKPLATVTEVGQGEASGEKSDGNNAKPQTETVTLKLRRENGQWKVWAMRVSLIPGGVGPMLTMDFEHPEAFVGEAFKGMGEGLGAAMKGMGEGLGAMFKGMAEGAKATEPRSR